MKDIGEQFPYQRVLVTGGAGFPGRHITKLLERYHGLEIFVPTRQEYDLVESSDVPCLLSETRPDLVIHLAAVVGGIGANQKKSRKVGSKHFLI